MTSTDLAIAVLREIRDEIRSTRSELSGRIDETNHKLEQMRSELKAEIVETNKRLDSVEGTLKDLTGQQLLLTRYVKNVVDRHDQPIDDLRERVARLETKISESR